MKILLTILWSILLITTPTIEQDNFMETVHKNYETYYLLVEEETVIGDIVIVVGCIEEQLYISGFIYNTTVNEHGFHINSKFYKQEFHKETINETISVKTTNGVFFKKYDLKDIKENYYTLSLIEGEGNNNFSTTKQELDITDIFSFLVLIFIGLITLFTVGIVIIYRKKMGRFNKQYINHTVDIIDVEEDVFYQEEKTQEEQMQDAYEEFKKGLITEEDLNNRLRRIWWEDHD